MTSNAKPSGRRGRSGGPATFAGVDLQARFAAYAACLILGEIHAAPMWGWPEDDTLHSVYVETAEEADDVLVTSLNGRRAFVQAKSRVQLRPSAGAPLGEAVDQLVRQFHSGTSDGDRLVLVVGPESSKGVREELPRVLTRLRALPLKGAVGDAATNAPEINALSVLLGHIRRSWLAVTNASPSDDELFPMLRMMRITVHDPSLEGEHAREAQNLLRSSVIADPSRAGAAFDALVTAAVGFGASQTGADRHDLQADLGRLGFALAGVPSYRADIAALVEHSRAAIDSLAQYSTIAGPSHKQVTIKRDASKVVASVAHQQSIVLTGDPGAGKSAVLHDFARSALDAGRTVVVFSSDGLAAGSVGGLRNELGLEHGVVDVLQNWPGNGPGFLVIDALDAARGEHTQKTLLDLIGETRARAPRWHIVAAIRRFDLRYNKHLQALLASAVPAADAEFQLAEFAGISHFNVPEFTASELEQLETLAPEVHRVATTASGDLRGLLRVPFNLRLLAELVGSGVTGNELSAIETQLQLLDRYWQHRVLDGNGGDEREIVLRAACSEMANRRELRFDRMVVQTEFAFAKPLNELLSRRVLVEYEVGAMARRETLSFAHHVLFDYAVARLLLRGPAASVVQQIAESPELLLVVRPSYDLLFRDLWELEADRVAFWDLALELASHGTTPAIGVVIGPSVAAQLVMTKADVDVLLSSVSGPESPRRNAADIVLRHVVGARLAVGPQGTNIPNEKRTVWAEIASCLAGTIRGRTAYPVRHLVTELTIDASRLDESQRSSTGRASRRLLAWTFAQTPGIPVINHTIAAVSRTFSSDPCESESLIRGLIEPERLAEWGFIELPELAHETAVLVEAAPGLVRDIYIAAFTHVERADTPTVVREGVLALSSTRQQDYATSHYVLAEAFPRFLRIAPNESLDALAAVRLAFAIRRGRTAATSQPPIEIAWVGSRVLIQPDGSDSWSMNDRDHDDETKMLAQFGARIAEIASDDHSQLRPIVSNLRAGVRPASVWCRLLRVASDDPAPFVPELEPLVTTPAVLTSPELSGSARAFLRAAFGLFPEAARRRIEQAVMSLPQTFDNPNAQRARECGAAERDRLLMVLAPAFLVSATARKRRAELGASEDTPELSEDGVFEPPAVSRLASEHGVDLSVPGNRRLERLRSPLEEFVARNRNRSAPYSEVDAIEGTLRTLTSELSTTTSGVADPAQLVQCWGSAAAAASAISYSEDLDPETTPALLAREVLLVAATLDDPRPSADDPEAFDGSPLWGVPAPRVDAARGLLALAWYEKLADRTTLEAIERLSTDQVPVVRLHVAEHLAYLRSTAPELMWSIADRLLTSDDSTAVLESLVRSLPQMTMPDGAAKLQAMLRLAYARVGDEGRPGASKLLDRCTGTMTELYVMCGEADAKVFLEEEIIAALKHDATRARSIPGLLRDALTHEASDRPADAAAVRRRAIGLAERLYSSASTAFEEWNVELATQAAEQDDSRAQSARAVARVVDAVATEVYFATGAFSERQSGEVRVTVAQRQRLYEEAPALLDLICDAPFAPTTHNVLRALESFVDFDPRGVFLRVARAVRAGQRGGYQNDSLAMNLVVQLVKRYLAEHQTLLQRDDECRDALIEVLGTFVEAGWPEALRLTYGLPDIYR